MKTYRVIKDIGKYRVNTIINTGDDGFEIDFAQLDEDGSIIVSKREILFSDPNYFEEVK